VPVPVSAIDFYCQNMAVSHLAALEVAYGSVVHITDFGTNFI